MRLYDETTTQSGASLATSPDTSPGDRRISTGTPEALACAVTSSSPSRTSTTTWKEASRLSSAARVVGPKPIRRIRAWGGLELIEELQVERVRSAGGFSRTEPTLRPPACSLITGSGPGWLGRIAMWPAGGARTGQKRTPASPNDARSRSPQNCTTTVAGHVLAISARLPNRSPGTPSASVTRGCSPDRTRGPRRPPRWWTERRLRRSQTRREVGRERVVAGDHDARVPHRRTRVEQQLHRHGAQIGEDVDQGVARSCRLPGSRERRLRRAARSKRPAWISQDSNIRGSAAPGRIRLITA